MCFSIHKMKAQLPFISPEAALTLLFCIILGLSVPKFVILTSFIGNQLVVTAHLHQMTLMEHGDLVAEFAGGQGYPTLPYAGVSAHRKQ